MSRVGVGVGGQRGGDGRLESSTRFGEGLTDADGKGLAVGDGAIPEAGREGVLELAFEVAFLNDGLERERKILDAMGGP